MNAQSILAAIDDLAEDWSSERDDRLRRTSLDRADFDALAATGFLGLVVPESHGGSWQSLAESGPTVVDAVQRIARGDHSVALVASMHPAVQIFWTASEHAPEPFSRAWAAQRADVFQSALDGHFWGTITSEPGSGGDILRTKATATPVDGALDRYRLRGAKHFGSGSEIVSYMITTAKPDGSEMPMGFYLDLRDQPWDGTAGMTITRRWDGMGMKATQSHATMLDGVEGVAWAWPEGILRGSATAGALGLAMYAAVIGAVVEAAMIETERRLGGRQLRPFEEVAWTQAQIDHWMLVQAQRGLVDTIAGSDAEIAVVAATKAKIGIAATAEAILQNVCRAVGGGAFSASSPFASWYEDVRALGYLRPPWALAFDQLIAARQPPKT
jgi:alkylation response protein AidB-like acyl-CoA dehydrogenase